MIRKLIFAGVVLWVLITANGLAAIVSLILGKAAIYSWDGAGQSVMLWVLIELVAIACAWGFIFWLSKGREGVSHGIDR